MSDPSKDFTPIQDEYDFFLSHSTVADADLDAYVERLRLFGLPAGPIRMLDFGCGPGSFTARFLRRHRLLGRQYAKSTPKVRRKYAADADRFEARFRAPVPRLGTPSAPSPLPYLALC
jgi:hypothetical protein